MEDKKNKQQFPDYASKFKICEQELSCPKTGETQSKQGV